MKRDTPAVVPTLCHNYGYLRLINTEINLAKLAVYLDYSVEVARRHKCAPIDEGRAGKPRCER
jgi:hypothetical protein